MANDGRDDWGERAFEPSPYEPPYVSPGQPPPPSPQAPPPADYPPPAHYPPPVPPKKGISRTAKILIGIALVLMGLVGACTAWFIRTVTAPVDEANEFLALVDAGDYLAAVEQTHPACGQVVTIADLEASFLYADIDYNLTNSSVINGRQATASGTLRINGVSQSGIYVYLNKIDDDWHVCEFGISGEVDD